MKKTVSISWVKILQKITLKNYTVEALATLSIADSFDFLVHSSVKGNILNMSKRGPGESRNADIWKQNKSSAKFVLLPVFQNSTEE